MKAIRGATTIKNDTPDEIRSAVKELLTKLLNDNGLTDGEIVCAVFSNTADIRSFYPAKAAREAGFCNIPLFSAQEPEIDGALPLCIRLMLLVNKDIEPVHVYLNGAAGLRRDISKVINIALDGPAGGGKSTVAKSVAEKLNILCLDTGAMYRACALKLLKSKTDLNDLSSVKNIIGNIDLKIEYSNGRQVTLLDGRDVSEDIRKNEISMLASTVSTIECVRVKMVELQRKIAEKTSCILDGRDIGTNVLPAAEFKFYLTASDDVRAKRRYDELISKGQQVSYEDVKNDVIKRDKQDKSRKIAPLKQADDAILIDSSEMTAREVVEFIVNKIQEKI